MAIVNTHYGFCAKGGAAIKFTYTGEYNARDDGVVELLTSGTITFLEPKVIDVFMVGGGASGFSPSYVRSPNKRGYGAGGSGYTRTIRKLIVSQGQEVPVTIGAGGVAKPNNGSSTAGSPTVFSSYTVGGGDASAGDGGGNGGSGGGGGVASNSDYGSGGSDGANGKQGSGSATGGRGQGFTTREFGENNGKLYSGAGGGGRYMVSSTPIISIGGTGGGGSGAWCTTNISSGSQAASAGGANTGGSGGGGAFDSTAAGTMPGGSGGSGIVCFREARELPELAGTWVLNARLYKAKSPITQSLNFRLSNTGSADFNSIIIDNDAVRARVVGQSGYSVLYTFSTNSWGGNVPPIRMTITSETASDEFRAWLASNATKQS